MTDTKAKKRIRAKNKRRESKDPKKEASGAVDAAESAPEKPTGPEPQGLKEKVKKGFLTEREALRLLANSPDTASPRMVGWLRRRL